MTPVQPVSGLVVTPQQVEYDQARDALSAERTSSRTSDSEHSSITVLHSGVGPEETSSALDAFLERHRPDWALVTGFCASLDRSLNTGDVLLARRVFSGPEVNTPERIRTDVRRMAEGVNRDVPLRHGSLLTVAEPVFRCTSKRSMKNEWSDCHAIDTETAVAGRLLSEHDVPFLAARVVLDRAIDDLTFIEELVRDRPEPPPREVISFVLRHPSALVPFANLTRKYLVASRRLNQFLGAFFRTR